MKNFNLNLVRLTVLAAVMLLAFTSCKKDPVVVVPDPIYTPTFSATAVTSNVGGVDAIDFLVTCTTDDIELISIVVTAPGGAGTDTFSGNGAIFLQSSPITFNQTWPKLIGSWTFNVKGNLKSGTNSGKSFDISVVVNV